MYTSETFKLISYPNSPTIPPTDLPDNIDDHDGNDNNGNKDDSNNSDSDDSNNSNSDDSNISNKDSSKKRKLDDTVIPFCKDCLLNLMKEIATDENPLNDNCYSKQFLTAEDQYQLMCSMLPRLKDHCSVKQLQYWIGQANIWGKPSRASRKNQRKAGRGLWVIDEQQRGEITSLNFRVSSFHILTIYSVAFITDTSDSVKAYWKYLKNDTKYITIGYARKSPTNETKESRIRYYN